MSYVTALYNDKRCKIECYWYRGGYTELIEAIRLKFHIKHDIELQLYNQKQDIYVSITKKQMSEIPKSSILKVIHPNDQTKKNQLSTSTSSTKNKHQPISEDEVNKMRQLWKIGSKCLCYSGSQEKWIEGEIINIVIDFEGEWLEIKYIRISFQTKQFKRFSEYIRPIISTNTKQSWYKPKKYKMYVIGNSQFHELALERYICHTNKLMPSTHHQHIQTIACGNKYSIYCDYHNQHFWASGCNENGECAIDKDKHIISTVTLITYFTDNNIKIKKVFTNISGSSTFWLTRNNCVYAHGTNNYYQLGLLNDGKNKYKPVLITSLFNVIDIKSAQYFCVALCDHSYVVINYWHKQNQDKDIIIPVDIVLLLKKFYGMKTEVYTTKHDFGAGKGKWNKMDFFSDKEIVKIEVGLTHGFFLEATGKLWVVGEPGNRVMDNTGKLGLGRLAYTANAINTPKEVRFAEVEIKIKDIKCGSEHSLAIDNSNKIYSWGANRFKQCGRDMTYWNYIKPQMIDSLKDEEIKWIKCGFSHSLACTMDDKYFIWGKNEYTECIVVHKDEVEEKSKKRIAKPFLINSLIEEQCHGKAIKDIFLGCENTKLLVVDS
eukprot:342114_1